MWFCYCVCTPKVRKETCSDYGYPCEPADIAIVVKQLFLKKQLTVEDIKILEKYGVKQLPPHENNGDTKKVCRIWKQALEKILLPLRLKGIVDLTGKAFTF